MCQTVLTGSTADRTAAWSSAGLPSPTGGRLDHRSPRGVELRWPALPYWRPARPQIVPRRELRWPAPPYWRPARPQIVPRRGAPLACPPLLAAELTQSLPRTALLACTLPLLMHAPMCERKTRTHTPKGGGKKSKEADRTAGTLQEIDN